MGVEAGARRCSPPCPTGYEPALLAFATTDAGLPRQDQRHGDPRRARPARRRAGVRRRRRGPLRRRRGVDGRRPPAGSPCSSDIRTGLPGVADEANGGDAAVALAVRRRTASIAEVVGGGVGDRRVPRPLAGARRAGVAASGRSASASTPTCRSPSRRVTDALKAAGITADELDHVDRHRRCTPGPCKRRGTAIGARPEALVDDLTARGRQHRARRTGRSLLADVLDRAEPGQTIAVVVARRRLRRVAAAHDRRARRVPRRGARPSRDQHRGDGRDDLAYAQFLTWRGFLDREPPRRPEPERPAAPPSLRTDDWKYGFVGSRDECGFVHLPPSRVCMGCGAIDQMEPVRMADVPGDDRHVHRRPPRLQPQPAGRRGRHRLRRRRPLPVRAHRRRPDDGAHRRPGRDDVPPPVHDRRHPQLLLEGAARSDRPPDERERRLTWHHTGSATGSPSSAWAARRSASTGTRRRRPAHRRRRPTRSASAGITLDDVDAFWLGTMGSGLSGLTPQPAAEDRLQAGHPRRELSAPPAPRRSATPATPSRPAPTTWRWRSASRS